jgi:antitoxin (DNA-binding transcriptional repressor) of toxin-antitoxin stability system
MQESKLDRAKAHKPIVIAVAGEPLGVVVPHDGGYRFLAVKLPAFAIDGQLFDTVEQAHLAVSQAVGQTGTAA